MARTAVSLPDPPWGLPPGLAWLCQGVSPGRRGHPGWGCSCPLDWPARIAALKGSHHCESVSQGAPPSSGRGGVTRAWDSTAGLLCTAPYVCNGSGFRFIQRRSLVTERAVVLAPARATEQPGRKQKSEGAPRGLPYRALHPGRDAAGPTLQPSKPTQRDTHAAQPQGLSLLLLLLFVKTEQISSCHPPPKEDVLASGSRHPQAGYESPKPRPRAVLCLAPP